jgi:hypothetical protein
MHRRGHPAELGPPFGSLPITSYREPKTERSEAKPSTGTSSESVRSSPASERNKSDYAGKGFCNVTTGGPARSAEHTRVGLRHARSDDVYVRRARFAARSAEDKPAASIAAVEEKRAQRPGRVALPDSEPRSSSSGNSRTKSTIAFAPTTDAA